MAGTVWRSGWPGWDGDSLHGERTGQAAGTVPVRVGCHVRVGGCGAVLKDAGQQLDRDQER